VTRQREGTLIGVRIPDDVLAKLDELAAARGVSRAAIIRDILKEATK
jgi:metal-responsive CopG/Arc/MetJ family transcriptional regulator